MEDSFNHDLTGVDQPFYRRPATFAWAVILLIGLLLIAVLAQM